MNIFKRLMAIVMVMAVLFAFAACAPAADPSTSGNNNTPSSSSKPNTDKPVPPASSSTPAQEDHFKVIVQDEDGNPIEGVKVQMCNTVSGVCQLPKKTDANGEINFTFAVEDNYYAAVKEAPEGYIFDENEHFDFESGELEKIITLKKAA